MSIGDIFFRLGFCYSDMTQCHPPIVYKCKLDLHICKEYCNILHIRKIVWHTTYCHVIYLDIWKIFRIFKGGEGGKNIQDFVIFAIQEVGRGENNAKKSGKRFG